MSNFSAAGLTISAVAARTGVSVEVLRAWERRFSFPRPQRLPSGHRRYGEDDVERIRQVVSLRAAGAPLDRAIAAARAGSEPATARSLYSGLRRARPDLDVHVLSRRAMLALSRAIEDECLAQAARPHLAVAFQHEDRYRRASHRWEGLAVSSASTIVFADFATSGHAGNGALEVALPEGDPGRREWAIVCDSPDAAAVMAGWERDDGTFEACWTVDPTAVRLGTRIARSLATQMAPHLFTDPLPEPDLAGAQPAALLQRAVALTNRAVAYLDR